MKNITHWLLGKHLNHGQLRQMALDFVDQVRQMHAKYPSGVGGFELDDFMMDEQMHIVWQIRTTVLNPAYCAPELLIRGAKASGTVSDLYSLGVLLFYLFERDLPHVRGERETWLEAKILRQPRQFYVLEEPWRSIISKLLSPSPHDRYRSVYGVWNDLNRAGDGDWQLGEADVYFPLQFPDDCGDWTILLEKVQSRINSGSSNIGVIGPEGCGKSTFLRKLRDELWRQGQVCSLVTADHMTDANWSQKIDAELRQQLAVCKGSNPLCNVVLLADIGEITDQHLIQLKDLVENFDAEISVVVTCNQKTKLQSEWVFFSLEPVNYESMSNWMRELLGNRTPSLELFTNSLFHWSGGNMTMIQLKLMEWVRDGSLWFDSDQHHWCWAISVLEQLSLSDYEQEQRMQQFNMLSTELQQLLDAATVIGDRFSLTELSILSGMSKEQLTNELSPAIHIGFIYIENSLESVMLMSANVRRMLYVRVDKKQRKLWQVQLGVYYLESGKQEATRRQWNEAIELLDQEQRMELARLNYEQGMVYYRCEQFVKACEALEMALKLEWTDVEPTAQACRIAIYLYQAYDYTGMKQLAISGFQQLEPWIKQLPQEEQLVAYGIAIEVHSFVENPRAVKFGEQALSILGWKFPSGVGKGAVLLSVLQTLRVIRRTYRKNKKISQGVESLEKQTKIIIHMLFALMSEDPLRFVYVLSKIVQRALLLGDFGPNVVLLLQWYQVLIQRFLPFLLPYWPQQELESIAAPLKLPEVSMAGMYSSGIVAQLDRPAEAEEIMLAILQDSREHMVLSIFNFTAITLLITHTGSLVRMQQLIDKIRDGNEPYLDKTSQLMLQFSESYYNAGQSLEAWDVYVHVTDFTAKPQPYDNFDCVLRAEQAYLAGKYRETLYWTGWAKQIELKQDLVRNRRTRIFEVLAQLALNKNGKGERTSSRVSQRLLRKMRAWQGQHGYRSTAYWLVVAEYERVRGRMPIAARAYEAALRQSQEEWPGVFKPLCYERMGVFYEQEGLEAGAVMALVEASVAYRGFGHLAKVEWMRKQYKVLAIYDQFQSDESEDEPGSYVLPLRYSSVHEQVEWHSKFGFESMNTEDLIKSCCRLTGADNGIILETLNDVDYITSARYGRASSGGACYLPSIVEVVRSLGAPIIVEDAQDSCYQNDEANAEYRRRSVIGMPIRLARSRLPMVLYMENSALAGVFTKQTLVDVEEVITKFSYLLLFQQKVSTTQQSVAVEPRQLKEENRTMALEPLTSREEEVLRALVQGMSNKEIAEHLFIGETTVKTHVSRLYAKLGVKRRSQAIARAQEMDLG